MLKPGQEFPVFSLEAEDGSVVDSASLESQPYLIYFYPRANTPGCTREACSFRNAWHDLSEAGLTVFGVSFDSPSRNRAFAAKYQLPFRLLSDEGGKLATKVDAKMPFLPVPRRISYLVGGNGAILAGYAKVHPSRHAEEVLEDYKHLT